MKLRRCPNMHYYDEDKYAQCPHCAASKPAAPAPKPAEPAPAPSPVQTALPQPEPAPDEMWRCSCGTVNNGRFCVQCGSPRPSAEPTAPEAPAPAEAGKWTCGCGQENEGNFCFRCGAPRPAAVREPAEKPELPSPEVSEPEPETAEPEAGKSLTSVISEVSFTGSIEDAKVKAAGDDEGVTQIIFDELADELVLGWLVAANTEIKGKVFTVAETNVTVGRSDPEHPVGIDLHGDRAVSRGAQAVIVYDPLNKKFFIQSAGGKTPVYVNRKMLLAPAELSAYDIILLGTTELVFVPLCSEKFSW